MQLTESRYYELISYAKANFTHEAIDPIDLVHEAIIKNPNCGVADIKNEFFRERRRLQSLKDLQAQSSSFKYSGEKYCFRCKLPFSPRSTNSHQSYCSPCLNIIYHEKYASKYPSYRERNRAKINNTSNKHYHSRKGQKTRKKYLQKNHAIIAEKNRKYVAANIEKVKKWKHDWYQRKKKLAQISDSM